MRKTDVNPTRDDGLRSYIKRPLKRSSITAVLAVIMALLLAYTANAVSGQTLYNGIVLRTPADHPVEDPNIPIETLPADPSLPYYMNAGLPNPIRIDVGRQLFVDNFLIGNTRNLKRTPHNPVDHPGNPVFEALPTPHWEAAGSEDKPFGAPYNDGIWWDPSVNLWKMWYMGGYSSRTGYATSHDGITWTRHPSNPLNMDQANRDAGMVWLDLRPEVPAWERYKMSRYRAGLEIRTSADGIIWTPPIITYNSKTQLGGDHTTFAFNPFRNMWVFLLRGQESKYSYSRYKRYAEGSSFTANNWTNFATRPHWLRADNLDKALWDEGLDLEENAKTPDLYDFQMAPYESLMLGFFCVQAYEAEHDFDFDPPRQVAPFRPKHNYITLGYSRDGFHFQRPDRHVWLGPADDPNPNDGPKNSPWNWGNVQIVGGLLGVVGEELYIYYSARGGWGNPDGFFSPPFWDGTHTRMGLATMRRDGFVSYDAGSTEGTLTTRNVQFTYNPGHFFVNAAVAPGGSVRVEVLDSSGIPITGFTKADSSPISGAGVGSTKQRVTWSGRSIGSLANRAVQFKFYVTNASLYSFWVSNHANGHSNGYVAQGGPGFLSNKDDGGPVGTSEVEVRGNDTVIAAGDSTPSTLNHTDFGVVSAGGTPVTRTFTVHNTGRTALATTGVNLPNGYRLIEGLSASVPVGSSDSFTMQLQTANAGVFTGDIGFGNNDSDENPFGFRVTGTIAGAEVKVTGNNLDIPDGDNTPYMADNTLFGTIAEGGTPVTRTYTVSNTGTTTLTLNSMRLPAGFISGGDSLVTSLAPKASDTFNVTLPTTTQGTFDGDISFTTNDGDETSFNFRIRGRIGPVGPAIALIGKNQDITNGDNTPSTTDHTDFGTQPQGTLTPVERRFIVTNRGTSNLSISDLRVPNGFKTSPIVATLTPSQSHAFTVQLLAGSTPGTYSGEITFNTNDTDQSAFSFSVTGTVLLAGDAPEAEVRGNALAIADGDSSPSPIDDTDFGSAAAGAGPVTRVFAVHNIGAKPLITSGLAVSGGFMITESLASSIAPGGSDTFSVQLPTVKAGAYVGTVSFYSNDSNENPYSFRIAGVVDSGNEAEVRGNNVVITDGDTAPAASDHTDFGSSSTAVTRVFTVFNRGMVPLSTSALAVTGGFMVTEGLSANIAIGAADTFSIQMPDKSPGSYSGVVSFIIKGNDENTFNFNITGKVTANGSPVVTVSVPDPIAAESGSPSTDKGRIRFTRSITTSGPLTVSFSRSGTAMYGATRDYMLKDDDGKPITTSIVINGNESFADVIIEPYDNVTVEPMETAILMVTSQAGYTVGALNDGMVTIADNEPVVGIAAIDAEARESGTSPSKSGMIRINLTTPPTLAPLMVRFTLAGSSAVHPGDYSMIVMNLDGSESPTVGGSPVAVPIGRTHVDIRIKPVDDTISEDVETVKVSLMASAAGKYTLGSDRVAIVNIGSNE